MDKPCQLGYEQQLERLSQLGVKCKPDKKEKDVETLKSIGYYNLKVFAMPFNTSCDKEHLHFDNLTFEQLLTRYYQDKNLRINILHAIECIEVYLKDCFSYILGDSYGAYGYLNFYSWCDHNKFKNKRFYIEEEQYRFKKILLSSVKKSNNYDLKQRSNLREGFPIVWLMVNVLTLGEIIRIIKLASKKNKTKLSRYFNTDYDTLESWLNCLVLVRNICSHNFNLIDIKLKTRPKVPDEFKNELFQVNENVFTDRIGIIIFIIVSMMKNINSRYDFGSIRNSLKSIIRGDNNLAKELGFADKHSLYKLPLTRKHYSKKRYKH